MIGDEEGTVYEYDLEDEDIRNALHFGKSGDYEGIELVDSTIYVVKSSGDVYEMPYSLSDKVEAKKYENILNSDNDIEGLGYDPVSNKLLLACKGDGDTKENKAKGKAIYGFDIKKKELVEDEIFSISSEKLEIFLEQHREFDYDDDKLVFKPSGIAYHPIQKVYYVLASVGNLLCVVDTNGDILALYPILEHILGQPEGLCFSPEGDLYISSEGQGDKGYMMKFKMKTK
jgi:uncharacterized protein YjiK